MRPASDTARRDVSPLLWRLSDAYFAAASLAQERASFAKSDLNFPL